MPEEETSVQQTPAQVAVSNPAPNNNNNNNNNLGTNGTKIENKTPNKLDQNNTHKLNNTNNNNNMQKNNNNQNQHKFVNQNQKNVNQIKNGMPRAQSAQNINGQQTKKPNHNPQQQQQQQQQKKFNPNFQSNRQFNAPEQPQGERKFTGRCRLFVGNLPAEITEQELKDLFTKFGETGEIFINTQRSFGFIKLDTRLNAEHAKQEMDGFAFKGRFLRVRFACHGAAVRVKNLSPFVSNEYLEQAFSTFGRVERAVVIVDEKGRSTGEGIVEFERKPSAAQCLTRCSENCFILTSYPKPVIVEPLDQKDDEDGLPEKSIMKNPQFHVEREVAPHFAQNNSFEFEMALKWRDLFELEKQIKEEGLKKIQEAREQLEYEIEVRLIDYKEQKIKEDLRAKQEELMRIEDMRKNEFQRRKDMDSRRDEMMMYNKQNSIMGNQPGNPRMQGNGPNMNGPQGNYDGPMMNQPNMPPMMQNGPGNRRFDQSNGYPNQNMNQNMNNMPPQQQAMLAAQLSAFAMAANMNGMNMNGPNGPNGPMFDQGPPPQQMQNQGRNDQRGGRNFNRRGGGNMNRGPHREDQSPFPGYDPKRARY